MNEQLCQHLSGLPPFAPDLSIPALSPSSGASLQHLVWQADAKARRQNAGTRRGAREARLLYVTAAILIAIWFPTAITEVVNTKTLSAWRRKLPSPPCLTTRCRLNNEQRSRWWTLALLLNRVVADPRGTASREILTPAAEAPACSSKKQVFFPSTLRVSLAFHRCLTLSLYLVQ